MRTVTVERVMKNSIVYGYAVTQPFLLYVDSGLQMHDAILQETDVQKYGENSKIVRHIQHKLSELGYYEDGIDGYYGLLTEHAVKGFQSSSHIDVTGQVDQQTMKTLIREEKKKQLKEIKTEIDSITYGENSDAVTKVQEVLLYYGYYTGNIDGMYGPLTENALQKIKSEGLLNDHPEMTLKDESNKVIQNHNEKEVIQLKVTNDTNIIQAAKNLIGIPYVWGGTSPNGFDCSGFIQYVYGKENKSIPRTVREIWNFADPINQPKIGDLVFFETYQAGPSHMGIYLGNGNFIHAGSSSGVTISNMNDTQYWQTRYIGAKRIN